MSIILDATNKSLQFKLGTATTTNPLPFAASYVDITSTTTLPGEQDGTSAGTTAVTVAASPAASTQRILKSLQIFNADTVAATVTIIYNNAATLRNIAIITLGVGDILQYEDSVGFKVNNSAGSMKTTGGNLAGNGLALTNQTFSIDTSITVDKTTAQTLTNKRFIPRLQTVIAPGVTPSINTDNYDIATFTGLLANITSMTTNLTGTPVDPQFLMIEFTDNGTPRTIAWGTSFASTTVATLPVTTVASTILRTGFKWNAVTSKWDCIAVD